MSRFLRIFFPTGWGLNLVSVGYRISKINTEEVGSSNKWSRLGITYFFFLERTLCGHYCIKAEAFISQKFGPCYLRWYNDPIIVKGSQKS